MFIRKVTTAETDLLLAISKQTFFAAFEKQNNPADFKLYTDGAFRRDKLEAELANPNSAFYFAVIDDDIVGYIKLNFADAQTEFRDADALEIERIYVSAAYQGRDIGSQLLNFADSKAQENNFKYLWLGVWETNVNAQRFYERAGFKKFSKHYFMVGNDRQTDILMKKTL
jgi:ribosomal protein S18 acetylase RimI-like enzyme